MSTKCSRPLWSPKLTLMHKLFIWHKGGKKRMLCMAHSKINRKHSLLRHWFYSLLFIIYSSLRFQLQLNWNTLSNQEVSCHIHMVKLAVPKNVFRLIQLFLQHMMCAWERERERGRLHYQQLYFTDLTISDNKNFWNKYGKVSPNIFGQLLPVKKKGT